MCPISDSRKIAIQNIIPFLSLFQVTGKVFQTFVLKGQLRK